ncbi:MAG TPA: twin-arginine translocation signal domain-containing protein [Terriglobales bacterium]|nr:twin-arginine translocation signal domain-containing protein [Terriglobales bacterium]
MPSKHSPSWRTLARLPETSVSPPTIHNVGHSHFWARALSRRNFIASSAAAAGLAIAPSLTFPTLAEAEGNSPGLFCSPSPTPITGGTELLGPGTELFHFFLPGPGSEPSTVGNFNGCIGLASGHGTGTITDDSGESSVTFANDVRFMTGTYVGQDGKQRKGSFAFV